MDCRLLKIQISATECKWIQPGSSAYDETSNKDELEQTTAPSVVEGDQPQLGTDQVATAHQLVEEETGPTSNLNPTPAFVAIPSCGKNVKPSNGHQIDKDVAKAANVATKKSDWS
jgi:hypothetical protein